VAEGYTSAMVDIANADVSQARLASGSQEPLERREAWSCCASFGFRAVAVRDGCRPVAQRFIHRGPSACRRRRLATSPARERARCCFRSLWQRASFELSPAEPQLGFTRKVAATDPELAVVALLRRGGPPEVGQGIGHRRGGVPGSKREHAAMSQAYSGGPNGRRLV
jgi:hypothetical protein